MRVSTISPAFYPYRANVVTYIPNGLHRLFFYMERLTHNFRTGIQTDSKKKAGELL